MGASYELSRRERRLGGPEKPLSELGKKGYLSFWEARVARVILESRTKSNSTVQEIAETAWMLVEDAIEALKKMGVVVPRKKVEGTVLISKMKVREWVTLNKVDLASPVDENCFVDEWIPYVPGEEEH